MRAIVLLTMFSACWLLLCCQLGSAAPPVKKITPADQKRLDELEAAIEAPFHAGDLAAERDAREAFQSEYLKFHDENSPVAVTGNKQLESVRRTLALDSAAQSRITTARKDFANAFKAVIQRDFAAGQKGFRAAADAYQELLGKDDIQFADALRSYAVATANVEGYEQAVEMFRETTATYEDIVGRDHPRLIQMHRDIARACVELERWNEAEESLQRSRAIRAAGDFGTAKENAHLDLLWSRIQLQLGHNEEAQRAAEQAIAITAADPNLISVQQAAYMLLGESLTWQKKHYAASEAFGVAFSKLAKERALAGSPSTISAMSHYALSLREIGRIELADEVSTRCAQMQAALEARKQRK